MSDIDERCVLAKNIADDMQAMCNKKNDALLENVFVELRDAVEVVRETHTLLPMLKPIPEDRERTALREILETIKATVTKTVDELPQ